MLEMMEDLSGVTLTSRSRITDHPEYAKPVLMTQYGWKQGNKVVWNKDVEIKEIPCHT